MKAKDLVEACSKARTFKRAKDFDDAARKTLAQHKEQEQENVDDDKGGPGIFSSVVKTLSLIFSITLLLKGISKAKSGSSLSSAEDQSERPANKTAKNYARRSDL